MNWVPNLFFFFFTFEARLVESKVVQGPYTDQSDSWSKSWYNLYFIIAK